MGKTLFDKVWDLHVVKKIENGPQVLYIDKHFIHEVTSPQAFSELETRNIPVFRPQQIVATADHNTPTLDQHLPVKDALSRKQLEALTENCTKNNITLFELGHENNGIVHVIAPELALSEWEARPEIVDAGDNYVLVTLIDPFSQRNGRINGYSVVVTTDQEDPEIKAEARLSTWKEAKDGQKKSWMVRIY